MKPELHMLAFLEHYWPTGEQVSLSKRTVTTQNKSSLLWTSAWFWLIEFPLWEPVSIDELVFPPLLLLPQFRIFSWRWSISYIHEACFLLQLFSLLNIVGVSYWSSQRRGWLCVLYYPRTLQTDCLIPTAPFSPYPYCCYLLPVVTALSD